MNMEVSGIFIVTGTGIPKQAGTGKEHHDSFSSLIQKFRF